MESLFDNDPVYQGVGKVTMRSLPIRNHLGQFCTKEQKRIESVERENRILRRKAETYLHNWLAMGKKAAKMERENQELKEKLRETWETVKSITQSAQ